ncbi:MAG: hypothetical protein P4L36_01135 [Holophaga sp.]|nr:hypothetical protein [Holophaga sp.]
MLNALIPTLFLLAQDSVAVPPPTPPPAQEAPAPVTASAPAPAQGQRPLSFFSQRFKFRWDQFLPLTASVDGLRINSIFFNKRTLGLFKSAEFGTRAVVDVTNTSSVTRTPGFAVAVFDAQDRLLGVASGGPKIGGVRAGETESFDLSFRQVVERIPRADHFVLSVELSD